MSATNRLILSLEERAEKAEAGVASLEAERDEARGIVGDIHWMAQRYADGRSTYAPDMFNDAIRKAYTAGWLVYDECSPDPQYARDGMSPDYTSDRAKIASLEAERDMWKEMWAGDCHIANDFATRMMAAESERDALRVALADCEQHILALYNSISPHAEYVIDGKTGNRFADKEPCVIAARALSGGES